MGCISAKESSKEKDRKLSVFKNSDRTSNITQVENEQTSGVDNKINQVQHFKSHMSTEQELVITRNAT